MRSERPIVRFASTPRQLDIREHLQQISIRITEEQRAMSKGLVSGRREQIDALPHEFVGALINFGSGNLECQLKRGAAVGRRNIGCCSARFGQGQGIVAHPIFDPTRRKLSQQSKTKDAFIEAAHGCHIARENDRVVDRPNGLECRTGMRIPFAHDGFFIDGSLPFSSRRRSPDWARRPAQAGFSTIATIPAARGRSAPKRSAACFALYTPRCGAEARSWHPATPSRDRGCRQGCPRGISRPQPRQHCRPAEGHGPTA